MDSIKPDSSRYPRLHEEAIYRFGEFELDLDRNELRRDGREVMLTGKAMSVLVYLVRNRARPVARQELLTVLWPDTQVATGSLSQAIWEIRRALSDARGARRIIKTLHGKGYRFDAPVQVPDVASEPSFGSSRGRTLSEALSERLQALPTEALSIVLEFVDRLADRRATDWVRHLALPPESIDRKAGRLREN